MEKKKNGLGRKFIIVEHVLSKHTIPEKVLRGSFDNYYGKKVQNQINGKRSRIGLGRTIC